MSPLALVLLYLGICGIAFFAVGYIKVPPAVKENDIQSLRPWAMYALVSALVSFIWAFLFLHQAHSEWWQQLTLSFLVAFLQLVFNVVVYSLGAYMAGRRDGKLGR